MDYVFLCSNIQDMKSLEMNEWKAKNQAYSLHIIMWDENIHKTVFINDVILEAIETLEKGRM